MRMDEPDEGWSALEQRLALLTGVHPDAVFVMKQEDDVDGSVIVSISLDTSSDAERVSTFLDATSVSALSAALGAAVKSKSTTTTAFEVTLEPKPLTEVKKGIEEKNDGDSSVPGWTIALAVVGTAVVVALAGVVFWKKCKEPFVILVGKPVVSSTKGTEMEVASADIDASPSKNGHAHAKNGQADEKNGKEPPESPRDEKNGHV